MPRGLAPPQRPTGYRRASAIPAMLDPPMSGRRLCTYLIVLVALAVASGCGSGGSSTHSSHQPEASSSSATPITATALIHRAPGAHGREPGLPSPPAAGVCGRPSTALVTIELFPDLPSPRCVEVTGAERLRLVNRSGAYGQQPALVSVWFAGFAAKIRANQAVVFAEPFGDYLRPGTHSVEVSGAPGPVSLRLLH